MSRILVAMSGGVDSSVAAALLQEQPVNAYRFQGTRFDCGTHLGLIEATIRYALDHEKLSDAAQGLMQDALREMGVTELE